MKKHKHAIQNVRQALKLLTEQKRDTQAQIKALKFDAEGKRRPETGPARSELRRAYNNHTRPDARVAHLALGLLRGRPYKALEAKTLEGNVPSAYYIHKLILQACEGDAELKAEWTEGRVSDWLDGTESTGKVAA